MSFHGMFVIWRLPFQRLSSETAMTAKEVLFSNIRKSAERRGLRVQLDQDGDAMVFTSKNRTGGRHEIARLSLRTALAIVRSMPNAS